VDDAPRFIARTAPPEVAMRAALDRLERGDAVAVATVLRRKGSSPATPGQKLALLADGDLVGTVGGGALELQVIDALRGALDGGPPGPRVVTYPLGATLGMCCGGTVEVLIEAFRAAPLVTIIGAGHIGRALAAVLADLGFRLVVADAREGAIAEVAVAPRPGGQAPRLLAVEFDDEELIAAVGAPDRAAALVMTHDHQLDQAAIEWALRKRFAMVGGIGSRAKAARTRTRLEAKGFAPADVERVRMPLGLEIGARTPAEIAIAVAGEMVRWRAQLATSEREAHRAGESGA
jgi:xanthine dehydrogenase accessory factor